MKRLLWISGTILLLLILLFLFRHSILRGMGNYLKVGKEPEKSEVMFVLSGSPKDRGREAARIYHEGFVKKIICTGGNKPVDLQALGLDYYESELTKSELVRRQVPDSVIQLINEGTSTLEESDVAMNYCKKNNINSCIVVSSIFHTKRVQYVFKKKFEKNHIKITICGAHPADLPESEWWTNEYLLLSVINEYVKLMYYAVK